MYLTRFEERELLPALSYKEATALIGPRRVGKTTLAKRMLETWEAQGKAGAYLDFESPGAPSTLAGIMAEIQKVPKRGLVVLDEVQAVPGWVKAVRAEVEAGRRKLVVTGSSASLLSSEIAGALGGRAIPVRVLPLSYPDAKNWGVKSLDEYLKVGGYPECVLRKGDATMLHRLYLDITVLRDVAARKGIREPKPLSDLALILLSEPGKTISAKKTSEKLGIAQPTFRSFVQGFNDAFLVLSVPPYHRSPRERLIADSRHYAYDVGLASSVSLSQSADAGRKLENLVAVELVRRGYSLSYLKTDGGECDFIAQKSGTKTLAVQVFSGTKGLPERELAGLRIGMKHANAQGLLLTTEPVRMPDGIASSCIEEWLLRKETM